MWDQANRRFFWFAKTILPKQNQSKKRELWNARTIFLVQKSGLIPPALVDESRVPRFYRDTISQCGADSANKVPELNEVFCLMWRSGLSEPVLQAIWESVSPANKDQLTRQEFYSSCIQRNMTIADLSAMSSLPIPKLSAVKPKETTFKGFKNDANLAKPNGHLMKTVHPLFTEQNVKVDGNLISFNDSTARDEQVKVPDSADLVLYPSADRSSNEEFLELQEKLVPFWENMVDSAFEFFSVVQQTNSNIIPAFRTEKGVQFVIALHCIEQVVRRVYQSVRLCSASHPELISRCEILLGVWTNLVDILEWEELLEKPNEFERTEHLCNLCGVWTNVDNTHFDRDTELSYHIGCVNLWLNTVSSVLPRP